MVREREVSVQVPPGIETGQTIRITGEGEAELARKRLSPVARANRNAIFNCAASTGYRFRRRRWAGDILYEALKTWTRQLIPFDRDCAIFF